MGCPKYASVSLSIFLLLVFIATSSSALDLEKLAAYNGHHHTKRAGKIFYCLLINKLDLKISKKMFSFFYLKNLKDRIENFVKISNLKKL